MIGNSNTGKLHYPDCRAIGMMLESHKVETEDGAGFEPCGWCHTSNGLDSLDSYLKSKDHEGTEICNDPKISRIFYESGCLNCGSHEGIIKMYPHDHGVRLLGKEGKWWIYFDCETCNYQTALWKAQSRLKNKSENIKEGVTCSH